MKLLTWMGAVKNKVLASPMIHKFYKFKWYLDLGTNIAGWAMAKLPEIGGAIIILGVFNVAVSPTNMIWGVGILFVSVFILGYLYKQLGLFDRKVFVAQSKDPVMNEIYTMAKRWNEQNERRNKKL